MVPVIQRAILRTTVVLSAADAVTMLAFALVSILIARRFGAEQLGVYALATTLGGIVQIVADAGYNIWLPRVVAQQPAQIVPLLASAIAAKALLWLASCPLAIGVAAIQSSTAAVLTALALLDVLASSVSFSILGALRGIEWFITPQLVSSAYSITAAAGMSATVLAGADLWVALVVLCAVSTLRALHLVILFRGKTQQPFRLLDARAHVSLRSLVQQLRTQWRLWLVNISSTLLHRGPLVVLGVRSVPSEIGYFAAAFRIYSAARIIPGSLFNAALPQLTARRQQSQLSLHVLGIGLALSVIVATALWFSAPVVISATFALERAVTPLQLMAIAFAGLSLKTTFEVVLIGRLHDRVVAIGVTAVATATLVAAWFISPDASSFATLLIAGEWCLVAIFTIWLLHARSVS